MANATGRVVQIQGGVVDVEFPKNELPNLFDAIEIPTRIRVPACTGSTEAYG